MVVRGFGIWGLVLGGACEGPRHRRRVEIGSPGWFSGGWFRGMEAQGSRSRDEGVRIIDEILFPRFNPQESSPGRRDDRLYAKLAHDPKLEKRRAPCLAIKRETSVDRTSSSHTAATPRHYS